LPEDEGVVMNTIYALSSGAGLAAVAVVRVSGPRAGAAMAMMVGGPVPARRAVVRRLRDPATPGEAIDEALVLWLPGPASFTGEDMAEFQVHGGRAVVSALLGALSRQPGLRPAEAGEFTRRAFEAGRLDLVAVEGLADLIAAETEAQRRQALFQQQGGASAVFEGWREELLGILARHEAAIDFAEEDDVADAALRGVGARMARLEEQIRGSLAGAERGEKIRDGVRVVIAGAPNAGKSTLLNRLAGREAAIVSPLPGTTRDVIEVRLDLGGIAVILADTAGLHGVGGDAIEAEGMARARRRLAEADIIVWVASPDTDAGEVHEFDSPALRIWNKADMALPPALGGYDRSLAVSARSGDGIDRLLARLSDMVAERYGRSEPALVTRERQRLALEACCNELALARQMTGAGAELQAEHVRLAARALERLTGRIGVEELLGAIFSEFCIGK
jgi:tRNA modification GTPase